MQYFRSNISVDIPTDQSVSEFLEPDPSKASFSKIILEDTLNGRSISYGGLRDQVNYSAQWLRDVFGLRENQRVTVISPSCIDHVIAVQSIWHAGAIACAVNNLLHVHEMQYALGLIDPDVIIVHDSAYEPLVSALKDYNPSRVPRIITIGRVIPGQTQFPTELKYQRKTLPFPAFSLKGKDARKACALIVLSSGTSGKAKAVMLSHYNLITFCVQAHAHDPNNWKGSQREIFFPPMSHVYGIYVCALMTPWTGAYVCMVPRFEVEQYCRLMQDRKATLARMVPAVAKMLAMDPVVSKYSYPSLEYFSSSAAPLHPEIASRLRRVFPGIELCQTYGCTETTGAIAQSGIRDRNTIPLVAGGKLIANTEIRFLDPDTELDRGLRGPGEILVRSPSVTMGYKDNEEANATAFFDKDWLRTGDVGYIDANDYLIIIDRIKDVIKSNGFQVSPTELEEVLLTHELVEEAAVRGVASPDGATELPRAFIVLKQQQVGYDMNKEENKTQIATILVKFVAARVSTYKQIRGGICFLTELPRNSVGKMMRRLLPVQDRAYGVDILQSKI